MGIMHCHYEPQAVQSQERKPLDLLSPGEAEFHILSAEDHVAQNGNKSCKLNIRVNRGAARTFCNIYLTDKTGFWVQQITAALGNPDIMQIDEQTQQIAFNTDLMVDGRGKCEVKIREREGRGPQNDIKRFLPKATAQASASKSVSEFFKDDTGFTDDIPF